MVIRDGWDVGREVIKIRGLYFVYYNKSFLKGIGLVGLTLVYYSFGFVGV